MLIPHTRYPKFQLLIRHPTQGKVDVTSYVDSWEFQRGDVTGIGTGGSGADSVVSMLTFTLRNSGANIYFWDDSAVVNETIPLDESKEFPDDTPAEEFFTYLFQLEPSLARESFSPRNTQTPWNQDAPLLYDNREVEFWESENGELKLRCTMLIDDIKPEKSRIKITALDPAKRLQRAYIREKKIYGSEAGTPAEDVIQQIIDDYSSRKYSKTFSVSLYPGGTFNHTFDERPLAVEGTLEGDISSRPLFPNEITVVDTQVTVTIDINDINTYNKLILTYKIPFVELYCPVPSQFMITPYEVQYTTVWQAIQDIATQRGWYLGYKIMNGKWQLSFFEPPRTKSTPDWTLTADHDFYTQDLTISAKDVRNLIKIIYRDKTTGKRESVIIEDEASQERHDLIAMEIEEADTSNIDTYEEALKMATSALHDLSSQTATTNINMPLFMDLDLFDLIEIENQFISSTLDLFAVDSVRHSWSKNKYRTDLICSGKVIGGKKRWLSKETRPGRAEPVKKGDIAPEQIDTDRLGQGATTTEKIAERAISDFAKFSITDDRVDETTATDFIEIPNYSLNFTIANTAQVLLSGNALVRASFDPEPNGTSIDLGTILRWRLYRNGTLLDDIWYSNFVIRMSYYSTESSPFFSTDRSDNASFNRIMDLDSGNYEIKAEIMLAGKGSQYDFARVGIRSLNAVILKR